MREQFAAKMKQSKWKSKLEVKLGIETIAYVEGYPQPLTSMDDLSKLIEVEQLLAKVFNLRFHISVTKEG